MIKAVKVDISAQKITFTVRSCQFGDLKGRIYVGEGTNPAPGTPAHQLIIFSEKPYGIKEILVRGKDARSTFP